MKAEFIYICLRHRAINLDSSKECELRQDIQVVPYRGKKSMLPSCSDHLKVLLRPASKIDCCSGT